MLNRPLILASSSVYRRELLSRLQLPYICISPDVDETPLTGESPGMTAERLAHAKAVAVAAANPGALVIGSDQVAELHGQPLGKPGNHERAVRQLHQLSGQHVIFHTAVCLIDASSGQHQLRNVPSSVQFRKLSDAQIERYLQREQPYDCAGSAKVESLGIALVERIESGDPTALIGLPLIALVSMLKQEGVEVI